MNIKQLGLEQQTLKQEIESILDQLEQLDEKDMTELAIKLSKCELALRKNKQLILSKIPTNIKR